MMRLHHVQISCPGMFDDAVAGYHRSYSADGNGNRVEIVSAG